MARKAKKVKDKDALGKFLKNYFKKSKKQKNKTPDEILEINMALVFKKDGVKEFSHMMLKDMSLNGSDICDEPYFIIIHPRDL